MYGGVFARYGTCVDLFVSLLTGSVFVFNLLPELVDGGLVFLDILLSLHPAAVGRVEGGFQLVDLSLELLLGADGVGLASLLSLERGLDGFDGVLVIFPIERDKERCNREGETAKQVDGFLGRCGLSRDSVTVNAGRPHRFAKKRKESEILSVKKNSETPIYREIKHPKSSGCIADIT